MSINDLLKEAESLHQNGKFVEARACYSSIVNVDVSNASAWYGLATLSMQERQYHDAKSLFQKALELEPEAPDIHYNFAVCLFKLGENEACVDALMQVSRFCQGDVSFLRSVASLLLQLQRPDAVLKILEGVKPNYQLRLARARAFGLMGEWGTSSALLAELYEQKRDPKISRELAQVAGKARNYPLAISAFTQYISAGRPSLQDHLDYADLCFMAKDIEACKKQLARFFRLGGRSAEAFVLQANVERLEGTYSTALKTVEQALSEDPLHAQAWSLFVELATQSQVKNSIDRLKNAVELSTDRSVFHRTLIHHCLADAYDKLSVYQHAIEYRHKANALQRSSLELGGTAYSAIGCESSFQKIIQRFARPYCHNVLPSETQPIFIVGMPRSGTTLVERIIGQIKTVETLGENEALGFIVSQYYRDLAEGKMDEPCELTPENWSHMAARYFAISRSESGVITDKLPHNVQHVGFILSAFPNAKIIQMRRNPVDVCLSIYERHFPDAHSYACAFEDLSHFYLNTSLLMDHWAGIAPERVLNIHYESLVSDSQLVARRLVDFCGLQWQDECLKFHEKLSASFTFSETQVRRPIDASRVARWRKYQPYIQPLIELLAVNFDVELGVD